LRSIPARVTEPPRGHSADVGASTLITIEGNASAEAAAGDDIASSQPTSANKPSRHPYLIFMKAAPDTDNDG
jgi:hypothetical protein